MFKKLIFTLPLAMASLATTLALVTAPAYATALGDVVTGTIEEPTSTPTAETPDTPTTFDTPEVPETPIASENSPEATTGATENPDPALPENNPESDSETNAASTANPILSFIEDQLGVEVDPEIWPLILSASVLVLTLVLIIVINLIARKKSRKSHKNRDEIADHFERERF